MAEKGKKKLSLSIKILIGLILGVVVGYILQTTGNEDIANNYIKPIGTLFLNLIKLIIVPLVFSSLIVGVGGLGDVTKIGRIGGKTFVYFLMTTCIAIIIGLVLANFGNVGGGFVLEGIEDLAYAAKEAPGFIDTLINIIPSNPLQAMVNGDMLQIIAFAIILGAGLLVAGDAAKPVFDVFNGLAEAMYKVTNGIMTLAPFGVFGLMTPVIATNGPEVLLPLLRLIVICYTASLIHMLVVYSLAVKGFAGMNPVTFIKGAFPAWAMAFTTSSSSGTLPLTMKCAEESFGVPKPIASFVLPLGATINMDGTAIYQGVCAVFIAQVYGLELGLTAQLTIVLTAVLASIGTAGVPGAGMVMLAMVLESVGLPLEGIALVAGVERILDMMRTSVNVVGDLSAAVVVTKSEGGFVEVQGDISA
ncbi:MAG: dicarboxylate/amino acid:cation symporter [Tissierellia bacterium]|nr:dicarboxylate/amino acid:cation symporter [Tissierellia bacterium]